MKELSQLYAYQVGAGYEEGSTHRTFFHERKFSQEELTSVVEECIAEAIANAFADGKDDEYFFHMSVQDVFYRHGEHFAAAMRRRDFITFEFVETVSYYGLDWIPERLPGFSKRGSKKNRPDLLRLRKRLKELIPDVMAKCAEWIASERRAYCQKMLEYRNENRKKTKDGD
jgi:hypothetical protein